MAGPAGGDKSGKGRGGPVPAGGDRVAQVGRWRPMRRSAVWQSGRRCGASAAIRAGALKLSVCVGVVGVRQPHGACSRFGTSYLFREFAESLAQVESVAQHVGSALRMAEQECEDRLVSLCCVAALACQNEVVAPVVGTLALSGCHVIQSDGGLVIAEAAVGADGPVSGEQPLSGCEVGAAMGGEGSQVWFGVGIGTSFSAAPATPRSWCRALLPGGLPSRGGATRTCSGFRHQKGLWYTRRTQPGAQRNRKSSTGRRAVGGAGRRLPNATPEPAPPSLAHNVTAVTGNVQ